MSDNFLNKLRQIRGKYGISDSQLRTLDSIDLKIRTNHSNFNNNKTLIPGMDRKPAMERSQGAIRRPRSGIKLKYNNLLSMQEPLRQIDDRKYAQNYTMNLDKSLSRITREPIQRRSSLYHINQRNHFQDYDKITLNHNKSNTIVNSHSQHRASSQPKVPSSNLYNTIDLSSLQNNRTPLLRQSHYKASKNTIDRLLQQELLLTLNKENLNLLYEPLKSKQVTTPLNVPAFSYQRQPLQLNNNSTSNWTVEKLSQVQEKIKAYLQK